MLKIYIIEIIESNSSLYMYRFGTCVAKQSDRDLSCFLVHEYRSSFIVCKMVKIVVKIKIKFLFLCYKNKKKIENAD